MSVQDDIRDLKDRVSNIEEFLRSVFPSAGGVGQTAPPASEGEDVFELISFDVKKAESMIGPEYSYRIGVRNKIGRPLTMHGKIVFLDKEEFEVCSEHTEIFTISPNSKIVITGKATVMDANHIPRIKHVTAELRHL